MKKMILKGVFFVAVLAISLIILEMIMNKGNTDMTAEMASAEFPLAYMSVDGVKVNCLHGYSSEMSAAYMRDTITPVETDRKIALEIDRYKDKVQNISYEVRSADGSRLIENSTIKNYQKTDTAITASFVIKDLIQEGNEYNLILTVQLASGQTVHYYTRLLEVENYHVAEKINFIKNFHEGTFDKNRAAKELVTYLEPDTTGDNSTYQTVNIHSNLKQITWGNLSATQVGETDIDIKEMMKETATFQVNFLVSTEQNNTKIYYAVTEYYRIRYTDQRIFLLDYTRKMNQLFDETAKVYSGNTITIGIQDPKNIQIEECEGGGIFAFVVGNRLFSYDIANNKMALLFSFYNQKNFDARTLYMEHKIKILNVDETGNVQFAVYGYMNRGRHEGSTGVQINMYNSTENTIEEQVYIPYTGSPDMLEKSLDKLIYADSRENLYLLLDSVVYQINLNAHSYKTVVSNLQENSYQVSKSGKMIAWSTGKSTDSSTKLMTMNLATGQQSSIDAQQGEFIKPLGFIGDDLIYGLAQQKDVKTDTNGHVSFLMYAVKIQDENGKVLKDYKENGMYITGCSVTNNQITVSRAQWNSSTNSLQTADSDQIMNSEAEEIGKNTISTAVSNSYETIAQLIVKNQMNTNSIRLLTPKEVLFEGENEVELKKKDNSVSRYFVYNLYGLDEIYTDPASAVNEAFNTSGAVVNDSGNYVWYKGNLQAKNQIMKIKGGVQKTDTKTAMAVCLDTILEFENVSRNSQYMLDSGKNVMEILQENISNIQALDLTGCKLDAILYYVNQDIPVLVTLGNGQAELLIGFNDTELVIMDPSDGTVHKINRKDAETQFEAAGSSYLSYIRTEE